jgi:hypothetical protein
MDELLTTDQYTALTGKTCDPLALRGASRAVRRHCGWSITSVTNAVQQLDSDGTAMLFLPCLAVTDVASLVVNGSAAWGSPYRQPLATDWEWYSDGTLKWLGLSSRAWAPGARRYTVTYSGGYDPQDVPEDILMVVCSMAERVIAPSAVHQRLSNTGGIQGNTTYSVNTDSNVLTAAEKADLTPYRIGQTR